MLTQVYEVATADEARAISAMGVDHIGVLVGDGRFPRELAIADAARVAAAIARPSRFCALFLSPDLPFIEQWARELQPNILHLGAAAELLLPQDCADLKRRLPGPALMRSIPVTGEDSVSIAQSYDGIVDFLLLDSHRAEDRQIGALGITHDWRISRRIVERLRTPVILAGGIGPDNVAEAIRVVRPAGVDSKTKTDRDGMHAKDIGRVRRFHLAARAAGSQ